MICIGKTKPTSEKGLLVFSINLVLVYRESVNLIGYITRRLYNNYSMSLRWT